MEELWERSGSALSWIGSLDLANGKKIRREVFNAVTLHLDCGSATFLLLQFARAPVGEEWPYSSWQFPAQPSGLVRRASNKEVTS